MNIFLLIGIIIAIPVSFLCVVGTFILYIKTKNKYNYFYDRDDNILRTTGLLVISIIVIPFVIICFWTAIVPILILLIIAYFTAKYVMKISERYEIKRKG